MAHYEHKEVGFNYRLSNICAGIGLGQVQVLDERVRQRRRIFKYYQQKLGNIAGISFQPEQEDAFSNRWLTSLQVDSGLAPGLLSRIFERCAAENIEVRPVWKPMHMQPVFRDKLFFGSDVAKRLFENGICLPSGSALTPEELNRITDCIVQASQ